MTGYCNSILFGFLGYKLNRVQSLLNDAACYICGRIHDDHVNYHLRDRLHWLRILERIAFKCCLLVYKSLHRLVPSYIADYCTKTTSASCRTGLRSDAHDELVVLRTKTRFGDHSFSVSGPATCNALLYYIRDASSVYILKSRLKTYLFGFSYKRFYNLSKHLCLQIISVMAVYKLSNSNNNNHNNNNNNNNNSK